MRQRVVIGRAFNLKAVVSDAPDPRPADVGRKSHRPVVAGRSWELQARANDNRVDLIDAVTRSGLVMVVGLISVLALAIATIPGLTQHNYTPLAAVWAVLGPIYGGIATYYFAPRRRK